METVILRNLTHNILWAVLALGAAVLASGPSFVHVAWDSVFLKNAGHFFVATALPSILTGAWCAVATKKCRFVVALLLPLVLSGGALILLAALGRFEDVRDNELRIVFWGFLVFTLIKTLEFVIARFRRVLPGIVKRVLVVGDGPLSEQMDNLASAIGGRYILLGRVRCFDNMCSETEDDGDAAAPEVEAGWLLRLARNFRADQLVISLAERRGAFPVEEMLGCKLAGIDVVDAPSFYEEVSRKLLIENITPSWFIFSHGFRVTWMLRFVKRVFDITASLAGLLCFLPLAPFIALAIKLDSPGPILFRQVRVGEADRPFMLMKFRTMRQDAESQTGAVWSQVDDPRITSVGRFLRKTRLDEVPQLINVLRGDMSLVGPRPERPEFVRRLKEIIPYYSERHYVKPGLTGWAQVCYPYGSSVEDAIEKLRYDLYYIKNISIFLDLYIAARTFIVVLFGRGR